MFVDHEVVPVTVNASGDATVYTGQVNGRVVQITYVPDPTTPLDTGADIVVTGEVSGVAIVTKANIGTSAFSLAPRQPTHAVSDGSALLFAAGGTAQSDAVYVSNERVKIVVAQGGNAKLGTFHVYVA